MTLRIRYNRVTTAGGVEPDTVTARQGVSFTSVAEEGSVGMSTIIVDDTANALDYVGRRRVYAYETACQAHNQIVYNGYLQKRWLGRIPPEGPDQDVEVMGRRWTLEIGDTNSLLSRRLITGADGDRPDETDVARIQWLLDSNNAYLSNPQDNWENPSPYVDTTGPVSMSAANYIGRTAFDVLNDCAQRSGKNWFVRYYEANDSVPPTNAGSYALWYADATSTLDTSTLRLTNVDADVDDSVTFAVLPDGQLSRDPTRAYSGNYLTYDGGSRYDQSTNVVNLFQRQDAATNNPFVKTDAEAAALQTRYLADAESEDDRLTFRYVCAKQYVNDLREGQRFSGKFSHLATVSGQDHSAWHWWRCLRRTVTHLNDEFYEVSGEASPIPEAEAVAAIVQQVSEVYSGAGQPSPTFPSPVTAGNHIIALLARRGPFSGAIMVPTLPSGLGSLNRPFTAFGADVSMAAGILGGPYELVMAWREATGDEQALEWNSDSQMHVTLFEVSGLDADPSVQATVLRANEQPAATSFPFGTLGSTGSLNFIGYLWNQDFTDTDNFSLGAGWTTDYSDSSDSNRPYVEYGHSSGSITATATASVTVEWGAFAVSLT